MFYAIPGNLLFILAKCPMDFDGYTCWPQALSGSSLNEDCPKLLQNGHDTEGQASKLIE